MNKIIYVPCVGYYVAAVAHYKFNYDVVKNLGYTGGINWAVYQILSHFVVMLSLMYFYTSTQ